MNTFFQFVTYLIFGKRWIKWDMLQGFKMSIFANEMEIEMDKEKFDDATKRKSELEESLKQLEESDLPDPKTLLPEDKQNDEKALYDMKKTIEGERKEQIIIFKNQIKQANTEVEIADGQLSKTYSIAYSNRRKYDFVKNYKIKATYADKK